MRVCLSDCFSNVFNYVKQQLNALPQIYSTFFIEAEEVVDIYADFEESFNALYVDFLGDGGSFQ